MDIPDDIARWSALANNRLTPIENIKTEIRTIRESLDRQFPSWKAAYEANRKDYLSHDARREYFVTLQVILQNAQFGFLHIRDHLSNSDWWMKQVGTFPESAVRQALREYALMIKFFSFHAIAMATEDTCRAIVRVDPLTFKVDAGRSFYSIYQRILKLARCEQSKNLFEVMRLTRNTIHTNGVYRPTKPKDRTIVYGGRTFRFKVGKILDWMGDDFPEWLASEMGQAMECIIRSAVVTQIVSCPRSN